MPQPRFISLSLATLALAACGGNPPGADENASGNAVAAADYYTVRAGPVADARIDALSGTFQMLKVSAANGIPSNGRGGACLVFAAGDLPGLDQIANKRCETNAQCQDANASAAYCDAQTHSCWVRPKKDPSGSQTCNRPITMTPTTLNPVPANPVDASPLDVKPGAKVRVVACLNKLGASPQLTGCGSIDGADRIEVFGPVATVK